VALVYPNVDALQGGAAQAVLRKARVDKLRELRVDVGACLAQTVLDCFLRGLLRLLGRLLLLAADFFAKVGGVTSHTSLLLDDPV